MKNKKFGLMIVAFAGLASFAMAENSGGDAQSSRQQMRMERFDVNKDGELSDTERDAMREKMKSRKSKGRKDSKGRNGLSEEKKAELIKKYDVDGDGVLSKTERTAMHAAGDLKKEMTAE